MEEREPHFTSVLRNRNHLPLVEEAARTVGARILSWTEMSDAVRAYGDEGTRLRCGRAPFEKVAAQHVAGGGLVYRLVSDPPEKGFSQDEVIRFAHERDFRINRLES